MSNIARVMYDFGQALDLLKSGHRIALSGWQGQYLTMMKVGSLDLHTGPVIDPVIFFSGKDYRLQPWTPSQRALLADDWVCVSVEPGVDPRSRPTMKVQVTDDPMDLNKSAQFRST